MTEEHFKLIKVVPKPAYPNVRFYVIEGDTFYIQNLQQACKVLNEQQETIIQLENKIQSLKHPPTLQDLPNPKLLEELRKRLSTPSTVEQTIRDAYENERTAIGKSVLKQLLERIEK